MPVDAVARAGRAVTALRLEGIPPSIAYRRGKLEQLLKPFGALATLAAADSRTFWRAVRDVLPFADKSDRAVWRISTAASVSAAVAAKIVESGADLFQDWAGGLIWVEMPDGAPRAELVRAALAGQGHALLVRADPAHRTGEVFEPLDPVLGAVTRRVKESFDPKGILSPGRMYAGV
jgi:glycolate oxidase FAD binding subunit